MSVGVTGRSSQRGFEVNQIVVIAAILWSPWALIRIGRIWWGDPNCGKFGTAVANAWCLKQADVADYLVVFVPLIILLAIVFYRRLAK